MHFPPFSRGSILGSTLGSILGGPTFVVSPRLFKTGSQFQDKISNPQSTIEYSKFQNRDNTPEFRWHNEFQMARAKIQLARRILNGTPNFEWHAKKFLARKSCDGTLARQHVGTPWHAGTLARWHAKARRHVWHAWHVGTLARLKTDGTLARVARDLADSETIPPSKIMFLNKRKHLKQITFIW